MARLEGELAAARAKLASVEELVNKSHDIVSRIDAQGRITYVSPSVRKILGYEPSELVGQLAHSFIEPSELPARLAGFAKGLKEGTAPTVVSRARRKDGSYLWMEYRTEVLRDEHGAVVGFQSSSHDVSAQQEAKEALARAEQNFETFVREMPVPALVHHKSNILFINTATFDVFGWAEADVVGRNVLDLVAPSDRAYIGGRLKRSVQELAGTATREHHVLHADGTPVAVEVTVVPVLFRGLPCSLAVYRDLREKKRLEGQLITADRMVALGRLAAGVGHEINNPLAYVISSLTLIERELAGIEFPKSSAMPELFANVKEGCERIRMVVEDLRAFSRERSETFGPVDLGRLLDRSASMASHEVSRRAQLVKDYSNLPSVAGNEARLGQVFLNLLVNAAQAIPEGNAAVNEVRIEGRAAEQGSVAIDIVDTGVGIEPEVAQHIFEPFFTTKPAGGTGLGLSISHHIVTSLGGTLRLVSSRTRETRFRVVLPCAS